MWKCKELAGVEVPEYAVDDLRERRRATTRERYEQSLREEAEERRQRDTVAIVPYIDRPSVGSDEAGPSRVRSEVPEGEMSLRKRFSSLESVLEAIQGLYKDYKCNLHSKEETRDEHGNVPLGLRDRVRSNADTAHYTPQEGKGKTTF
ncbi:hypothetical protein POM88_021230 [Heracleum sosnowskyi]|uniref:Uncharacterized protein n=1 Tax=Heracleum sosnowskyi TaxID=360622 RepID=A0AAD8ID69_9APIA|nr:hypothetical protein POM88_021230 [Heracleum sosnowskyi]